MKKASSHGFTLLELLTVMAIIVVLAGMVLGGIGYAQKRAASDRARAEIAAISVALESYKVDNGDYPKRQVSNDLNPQSAGAPAGYANSGAFLLAALEGRALPASGDEPAMAATSKRYFEAKADMVSTAEKVRDATSHMLDPFGNPYGYSTAGNYNPTFDLWSTAGRTGNTADDRVQWITNW